MSQVLIDKQIAYKDAIDRKEELLKQKYGYCDDNLLLTRHQLFYDVGFAAIIDKREGHKINKFLGLLYHPIAKEQDKINCIDYLYNHLSKSYNDQTINNYEILPEILQINRAFDRCVNVGLTENAKLLTGKSNQYFSYYEYGEGTTKVLPKDTKLELPVTRINIDVHGFAEPRGSEIAFFGRFLENVPSSNVTESGIYNSGAINAKLLLRTLYSGTILRHYYNVDQIILMHLIYQLSV